MGLASGPPDGRRAASALNRATPTVCHTGRRGGQSGRREYPRRHGDQTRGATRPSPAAGRRRRGPPRPLHRRTRGVHTAFAYARPACVACTDWLPRDWEPPLPLCQGDAVIDHGESSDTPLRRSRLADYADMPVEPQGEPTRATDSTPDPAHGGGRPHRGLPGAVSATVVSPTAVSARPARRRPVALVPRCGSPGRAGCDAGRRRGGPARVRSGAGALPDDGGARAAPGRGLADRGLRRRAMDPRVLRRVGAGPVRPRPGRRRRRVGLRDGARGPAAGRGRAERGGAVRGGPGRGGRRGARGAVSAGGRGRTGRGGGGQERHRRGRAGAAR